jgi:hypothetical protein
MRLAVLAVLLGAAFLAGAQPARIIVIRHAEKPEDPENNHLSEDGRVRAQRLIRWLTQGKVLDTNGPPAALYAPSPTRQGRGVRCLETLQPTARKLELPVRALYRSGDCEVLARDILEDKSLRGKNVVVCWVHEFLPHLAAALGVQPPPPKWKTDDFESAYVITFPHGKAVLEKTKERLKKN